MTQFFVVQSIAQPSFFMQHEQKRGRQPRWFLGPFLDTAWLFDTSFEAEDMAQKHLAYGTYQVRTMVNGELKVLGGLLGKPTDTASSAIYIYGIHANLRR